jgi:CTP synthase (UTP-ammonia lyase)
MTPVRISIIGDFNPDFHSHHATNHSLDHAAQALGLNLKWQWLPTDSLLEQNYERTLRDCQGVWISPGSPYRSIEGVLRAIQFARVRDWPLLGT